MSLVYHPDYLLHRQWSGHPERRERLEHIVTKLEKEGLFDIVMEPVEASNEQITGIHAKSYVEAVEHFGEGFLDVNSYVNEDTCTGCGVCWTECLTRRIPHDKQIVMGDTIVGERRPGER